jgi:hypothetical protein
MTNINNVPPPPAPPVEANHKPWIPYHHQPAEMMNPIVHNEDRRYSYGWHTPTANTRINPDLVKFNTPPSNIIYSPPPPVHRDVSQIMCPQFQQFEFCSRHDICPFAHHPTTNTIFNNGAMSPQHQSLYQQYTMKNSPPPSFFVSPQQQQLPKQKYQQQRRNNNVMMEQQQQQQQQDRYVDAQLDDFIGKLYELCKDQNGCRFLQKKIEEKENGEKCLTFVFNEIHSHFTELMTGKGTKKKEGGRFGLLKFICILYRSLW